MTNRHEQVYEEFLGAVEDAVSYERLLLELPGDSLLREKTAAAWRHLASVAEARAKSIETAKSGHAQA